MDHFNDLADLFSDFTPVILQRRRSDGWTPERQLGFLCALARLGAVGAAARAVGVSARSAYRLRMRPEAEHFAQMWDRAQDFGFHDVLGLAIDRCLNGVEVPVFRRGVQVGVRRKQDHRLLAAVLAGRNAERPDAWDLKRRREDLRTWDERAKTCDWPGVMRPAPDPLPDHDPPEPPPAPRPHPGPRIRLL